MSRKRRDLANIRLNFLAFYFEQNLRTGEWYFGIYAVKAPSFRRAVDFMMEFEESETATHPNVRDRTL